MVEALPGKDREMVPRLLFSIALLIVVAGCGGSDDPRPASPSASADAPQQALEQMQRSLRTVRSFHVEGTDTSRGDTTHLSGDWAAPGDARFLVRQGRGAAKMIILRRAAYLNAGAPFWAARGKLPPRAAAALAARWVRVPRTADLAELSRSIRPRGLAHCVTVNLGTVRDRGTQTKDGRRVRVLQLLGDAPGSAPGLVYADPRSGLPVRLIQTGPHRPGGTRDKVCDGPGGPDDSTASDIRFSRYDRPVSITAPRHPLRLRDLVAGLKNTTES